MEFRTRHQAMAWTGGLTLAGLSQNLLQIEHFMGVIAAFTGMFTWDKIQTAVKKVKKR